MTPTPAAAAGVEEVTAQAARRRTFAIVSHPDAAAEAEIYGAWMSAELAEHGYEISPGTLYPTLHRMEGEGLLRSRDAVVEGRRRRMYAITPQGRKALRQARRSLRELADEVLG